MTEMMIAGEAFNVRVEGDENAPVVMLAHPLGANLHVFDAIMPELLRHFRVVRYDARGHGSSVVTPGPYSLAQLGRDALGILDALGIEKADWIGASKGAAEGLWLLTEAPTRIRRAVLANVTAHFGSPDIWNERIKTAHEMGMGAVAPTVLENWFTKSFREHHPQDVDRIWEMLLACPVEGYAGACAALRDMDQRESIRAIKKPVLVIVGRHDPVTTPGHGALVASAIPGAKLVTLETAHLSCVEDPAGFSQAALEFLTVEEKTMGEETLHEQAAEVPQMPPPPVKKPRKPKAPRKPPAAAEAELHAEAAPTAEPDGEAAPEARETAEAAPPAEAEVIPTLPPLAPPRKPRPRRPAAAAPAPEPPAPISVAAPQRRKRPVRKAAAKKAAAKKAPAKKVAAKKAPAKKAAMRKARAMAPARKAVAKKTVARKAAAKKTATKKTAAKKAAVKKAPARKIAAKKAIVRKAVVKKTQAKKVVVKKAVAKKGVSRKALPRRMPGRRPAARKR